MTEHQLMREIYERSMTFIPHQAIPAVLSILYEERERAVKLCQESGQYDLAQQIRNTPYKF